MKNVRKDTPGCESVLHFNNAGAALMPTPVIKTMQDYLLLEAEQGGYEASDMRSAEIEGFYVSVGKLIGCSPDEVAYAENATRAWDMLFYALPLGPGDIVLTAYAEYVSNYLAFLHLKEKWGIEIVVIEDDESGQLSLSDLKAKLTPKVKCVAITHIPTNGGLINPAAEVGKICREKDVFYLIDATQSVGQLPVDVKAIGCDGLCATGRKFLRGPRGTGFLYINRKKISQLDPPFIDLQAATWTKRNSFSWQDSALRFETWEKNYGNLLGLKAAIDYQLNLGIENTWEKIQQLAISLRKGLSSLPGITVRDIGENQCGIVTFTKEGVAAEDIAKSLREKSINVSVSRVEYARLDMEHRSLPSLVRASVHYYNTQEEIEKFLHHLK